LDSVSSTGTQGVGLGLSFRVMNRWESSGGERCIRRCVPLQGPGDIEPREGGPPKSRISSDHFLTGGRREAASIAQSIALQCGVATRAAPHAPPGGILEEVPAAKLGS